MLHLELAQDTLQPEVKDKIDDGALFPLHIYRVTGEAMDGEAVD